MTLRDLKLDPVTEDVPIGDDAYPPGLEHLDIDSDGCCMLGVMFRTQGKGGHPTAVLLHGFPGHERNLDLAHMLRRAGWNSVVFHYRGAWGSEGDFTFSNMLKDVHACVEHLRSEKWEGVVDPANITLIGHSMGGWAALMTAAEDPGIRQVASLAGFDLGAMRIFLRDNEMVRGSMSAMLGELVKPLKGADPNRLIQEIIEKGEDWCINGIVERFRGKRTLLVGASRDQVAVPELHHVPISMGLSNACGGDATVRKIDSDHNFSDRRIELSKTLLGWLMNAH
ncbi:MAG: alpha/beta fold hydrolase [Candidatus Thermoplasmatota archaeon]|nr:alpha/beta fold hydrolase [Candidatus Thermoplasmatota archaeon]